MGFYFLLSLSLRLSIIITRLLLHHFFEEFSHTDRLEVSCLVSFVFFQHGAYVLVSDCCIEFEWSSLKLFPELSHMKKRFCPFEWDSISNLGTLCCQLLFPFVFCFLTLVWSNLQQTSQPSQLFLHLCSLLPTEFLLPFILHSSCLPLQYRGALDDSQYSHSIPWSSLHHVSKLLLQITWPSGLEFHWKW